jgi:MarR family transcriptional regulator for hemolysin
MTASPRLHDERIFSGLLLRLARIYRREVNRVLVEHNLSDARALPVLYIARSGGGMRQGHLAEELGVEGPSLVRILDQLGVAGLVERRDDPKDGRAKTLHLTPEGDAMAVVVEEAIQDLRTKLLKTISTDDLAAAVRVFTAFETALEAAAAADGRED